MLNEEKAHDSINGRAEVSKGYDVGLTKLEQFGDLETKFETIYAENLFKGDDSKSGEGSNHYQTRVIRKEIPKLLQQYGIRTMLDAPCGDWNWMKDVDLGDIHYQGLDIVSELIEKNTQRYAKKNISFQKRNLVDSKLPPVELIFSRDCLVHLSFHDAINVLQNFKQSGAKYLLTTTFTERATNVDLSSLFWRPLNMQVYPFLFPEPILLINEGCTEGEGNFSDKCLGLWKLDDIDLSHTQMKISITGANGYIGRHLCEHLSGLAYSVRGIVRREEAPLINRHHQTCVVGDMAGRPDYTSALEGCDVVIHTAARVHQMQDEACDIDLYDRVNFEGTKRVLEQAKAAKVKHFIFLSTVKVLGEQTQNSPASEKQQLNPQDPYAKSKLKAEEFIIDFCSQNNIRYTILRLPLVYGVGAKANFAKLYALSAKPIPLPLNGLKNKRSFLYVENFCIAIHAILTAKKAHSGVYNLSDDDDVTVGELVTIMRRAQHRRASTFTVPVSALKLLARLLNKKAEISRLTEPFVVSCEKFKQDFSWTPTYSVQQAIIDMTTKVTNKFYEKT